MAALPYTSTPVECTFAGLNCMEFAQRVSVAVQLSMAQEVAEALGLSVAADPRGW